MSARSLEMSERLWTGELEPGEVHPVVVNSDLDEVAPGVAFVPAFGSICAFDLGDELLLVDTGNRFLARRNFERVRGWTAAPLTTAVYTHGHIDHVFGLGPYEAEAAEKGWPQPHVVAHRDLPKRFDRYVLTAGYNGVINARQFKMGTFDWPTDYRYPDQTYDDRLDLVVAGERFELHHAMGETDDHTWTWAPDRRVLCSGDMFIWASPNCGNPQKVQRYPREWALALREMAALEPELLLPGHGWPIAGVDRVVQALTETADLLDSLVTQTLELMNQGARLDEIVQAVKAPPELLERPYLRPIYDEPEFVVRNLWRLYGGWYDGNPSHLKPSGDAALAGEVAALAGGAATLAGRALELLAGGDLRLAGHLAEMAAQAAPDDPGVHKARAEVFAARAAEELSTMSKGIFSWAADESSARAGG
ncbi:MAG TPA: alkyl sulfatase dimerization domain-containing protein [Acidimicrobiales bacterium]|nr:alkyl sulfatase dimerization domain-containing protein [Acidimicrobiales bacterium]